MIKNVIFDIGNVLLQFDREYLIRCFCSGSDFDIMWKAIFTDWEKQDDDSIPVDQFKKMVWNTLPEHLKQTGLDILNTWEEYMYETDGIYDLVKKLKDKGYKLYVLSNMTTHFIERDEKFRILKLFDGIVYSAPLKIMKPNPDFYTHLLDKYNLKAEESIFIDDKKENLATAARLSIKTFLFNKNTEELEKYILSL